MEQQGVEAAQDPLLIPQNPFVKGISGGGEAKAMMEEYSFKIGGVMEVQIPLKEKKG